MTATPDLDAVRERAQRLAETIKSVDAGELGPAALLTPATESAKDVPFLLAEVSLLNATIVSLRAEAALLAEAVDRLIVKQRRSA